PLSATFTPTDSLDYATVTASTTIDVTAVPLTITVADATRRYGDANPTFTATVPGLLDGDSPTITFSTPATASSDVGTYDVTASLSGIDSSNYSVTVHVGHLTITQASLTVTADDVARVYGAANPTSTAHYAGFVLGQGPAVLGGALLTFTTTATAASDP